MIYYGDRLLLSNFDDTISKEKYELSGGFKRKYMGINRRFSGEKSTHNPAGVFKKQMDSMKKALERFRITGAKINPGTLSGGLYFK